MESSVYFSHAREYDEKIVFCQEQLQVWESAKPENVKIERIFPYGYSYILETEKTELHCFQNFSDCNKTVPETMEDLISFEISYFQSCIKFYTHEKNKEYKRAMEELKEETIIQAFKEFLIKVRETVQMDDKEIKEMLEYLF